MKVRLLLRTPWYYQLADGLKVLTSFKLTMQRNFQNLKRYGVFNREIEYSDGVLGHLRDVMGRSRLSCGNEGFNVVYWLKRVGLVRNQKGKYGSSWHSAEESWAQA